MLTKRFLIKIFTLLILSSLNASGTDHYSTSFTLTSNLIIIKANVDGVDGNFIIDTGLDKLIINSSYELNQGSFSNIKTLFGEQIPSNREISSLQIGQLDRKSYISLLADISHLERRTNTKLLGIIGRSILLNYEVILDYKKTTITFHKLDRKGNHASFENQKNILDSVDLFYQNNALCLNVSYKENKYCFILDSGASINLMSDKIIEPTVKISKLLSGNVSGIGKTKQYDSLKLINPIFKIGNQLTNPMSSIIVNGKNNAIGLNNKLHGVLGFPFFSAQKVALNLRKRKMYLWPKGTNNPGTSCDDPFFIKNYNEKNIGLSNTIKMDRYNNYGHYMLPVGSKDFVVQFTPDYDINVDINVSNMKEVGGNSNLPRGLFLMEGGCPLQNIAIASDYIKHCEVCNSLTITNQRLIAGQTYYIVFDAESDYRFDLEIRESGVMQVLSSRE